MNFDTKSKCQAYYRLINFATLDKIILCNFDMYDLSFYYDPNFYLPSDDVKKSALERNINCTLIPSFNEKILKDFRMDVFHSDLSEQAKNLFGKAVLLSQQISSTQIFMVNDDFLNLPVGAVYIAITQTGGIGRKGNSWVSNRGCLMFSFSFSVPQSRVIFVQYLVTLLLQQTISDSVFGSLGVKIKWPNDLYVGQEKVGGVICQVANDFNPCDTPTAYSKVICGVGLNLENSHPTTCLKDELQKRGRTLRDEEWSKEKLLAAFLNRFEKELIRFQTEGFDPFLESYYSVWLHKGQIVDVEGKPFAMKGLSKDGFLEVLSEHGELKTLRPDGNRLDLLHSMIVMK